MSRKSFIGCMIVLSFLSLEARAADVAKSSEKVRKFDFTYQITLKNLPGNAQRVRVWIPVASSDANQTVVLKEARGPAHLRATRVPQFGDRLMYAEILHPKSPTAEFTLAYEITRKEYSKGNFQSLMKYNGADPLPKDIAFYLLPNHLVPVDGKIKTLADENTRGVQGPVEKAHALYDFVFHALRYDKSGTGWGRGDALWACDAKHGNCTDFHSLFISLARAEQIPARFDIGFPLPDGTHKGMVPGYHCWAEFWVEGAGWVPVDISEAWQTPAKHDYFFGTIDANRVQFSTGRDLTLVPKQDGPPLNYLVYPYVEVDGKPFDQMERKFSFHDRAAGPSGSVPRPRSNSSQ
ncbi:MAG: transglutaminase-like domain-containing protein [Acidobacteriia bacterium]|nr:transglutaminase-like domain-containing protein [Terriglobia bacterium]